MDDRLAILCRIAQKGGGAALRRRAEHGVNGVIAKSGDPLNIMSDLDRVAEETILMQLDATPEFRGIPVLSEEAGALPGSVAGRIVIDPIDGSLNAARDIGPWAVVIGVEDDHGEMVLAVVHLPIPGQTFAAKKGEGFWVDGQLRFQPPARPRPDGPPLRAAAIETPILGSQWEASARQRSRLFGLVPQSRSLITCSTALAWVADGRLDACVGFDLPPWDFAPGATLVRAAGGVAGERGLFVFAAGRGCAAELATCLE